MLSGLGYALEMCNLITIEKYHICCGDGQEGEQAQREGEAELGLGAHLVLPEDGLSQPEEHHLEPGPQHHPHQPLQ